MDAREVIGFLALGVLLCVCSAGSILGWHRRNA
jgi:hypothetical protein